MDNQKTMITFERLQEAYLRFYDELENDNHEVEQEVIDLEEEVNDALHYTFGTENEKLRELAMKIKNMKQEFDFYDEEAELNMMFPNRHDDDFDEDNMKNEGAFEDELLTKFRKERGIDNTIN